VVFSTQKEMERIRPSWNFWTHLSRDMLAFSSPSYYKRNYTNTEEVSSSW
jgi:hypothetical protein